MTDDKYLEDCKVCLATRTVTYEHAKSALQQYAQKIASIGYVGFLALWAQLWDKGVEDFWMAASGCLILISGGLFVGLEVVMMRCNFSAIAKEKVLLSKLAKSLEDGDKERIESVLDEIYTDQKPEEGFSLSNFLAIISIVTGFSAAGVLFLGIACSFFVK
ncbi:hypothetical protein [Maridesulfovibrio sp.]|uniref:hypothetical protein n=1 Tax=Maridesulfovibrio sp. TaxID=2795000 RepID=UPI003BAA97C7